MTAMAMAKEKERWGHLVDVTVAVHEDVLGDHLPALDKVHWQPAPCQPTYLIKSREWTEGGGWWSTDAGAIVKGEELLVEVGQLRQLHSSRSVVEHRRNVHLGGWVGGWVVSGKQVRVGTYLAVPGDGVLLGLGVARERAALQRAAPLLVVLLCAVQ